MTQMPQDQMLSLFSSRTPSAQAFADLLNEILSDKESAEIVKRLPTHKSLNEDQ